MKEFTENSNLQKIIRRLVSLFTADHKSLFHIRSD